MQYQGCRLAYAHDGTPFLALPLHTPLAQNQTVSPSMINVHELNSKRLPSLAEALERAAADFP